MEYLSNKKLEQSISQFLKVKQQKLSYELIIEDIKQSTVKRLSRNRPPLHDLEMYQTQYRQILIDYKASQHELAEDFYKLAEHLTHYAKNIIIDADDAIQEGVMICFEKIDRFNPRIGKAFSYMTQCIVNHYRQIYRSFKSYKSLQEKYKNFVAYCEGL